MSVQSSAGRRFVAVEAGVPASGLEAWQAVATGPGISSWFVPTVIETGADGVPVRIVSRFGPDMDAVAEVTAWQPPFRFAAESRDLGEDAPPLVTEWSVEPQGEGHARVRVSHSLAGEGDEWDEMLESWESGWPDFFRILQLHLRHFRGQPCAAFQVTGMAPEPAAKAWNALVRPLDLARAKAGEVRRTAAGGPVLAGRVECAGEGEHPEDLLLLLSEPAEGIAHLFAFAMEGAVYLTVRLYLHGGRAAAAAAREELRWQAWMAERFPMMADD